MAYTRKWFTPDRIKGLQDYLNVICEAQNPDEPIHLPSTWKRVLRETNHDSTEKVMRCGIDREQAREALKHLGLIRNTGHRGTGARWQITPGVTVKQAIDHHFSQLSLPLQNGTQAEIVARLEDRVGQLERALRVIAERADEIGQMARDTLAAPAELS